MKKQIIININKQGETKIEAVGYDGNGCVKATKPFEDLLGEVTEKQMKKNTELRKERNSLNA